MPKTNKACGRCGIIKEKLNTQMGIWERGYAQKLKVVQIRAYIPENPKAKRMYKEKKGKFKGQWIKIGYFCPRCLTFFIKKSLKPEDLAKLFPMQSISEDSKIKFII